MARQNELTDAYVSIGRELGAIVAPVGVAWQRVLGGKSSMKLHDRDGSHPNAWGTYLAACVFVAAVLGVSPLGLPADFRGLESIDTPSINKLQQAAAEAVASINHL